MIKKFKKAITIIVVTAFCAVWAVVAAACGNTNEWGKWRVSIAPTCTESGERIRYKNDDKTKFEKEEIPPLGHDWGEWHIVTPPTHTSEGVRDRTCKRCAEQDVSDIPMVPTTYYIDVMDVDGNRIDRVYTEDDGSYELTEPTLVGYEFIQFLTKGGDPFAVRGVIDDSMADEKRVEVIADFEVLPTTTFAQLVERAGGGAKKILLAADITVTGSVYVVGNTELTVENNYTLTRGADFGGDMFIVGETESGENTVLSGKPSSLALSAKNGGSLTIDGNKENMTVDVNGTAILVLNSATVTMGDGVTVKDCKKTANNKILTGYQISYPERIGGAGMIVVNGTFVMNGGSFIGNEVNTDETGSDTVGEGDEKDESNRASSTGGAIYAYADITINSGTFSENSAARGGAIYSYRHSTIKAATFSHNTAGVYAGAVYLPGSQYAAAYFGEENADGELVVIDGNTAQKSGGAVFGQMKNSITVYGGTTFKNNMAIESNGGAINTSGAVTIFDANFINNKAASKGGAIYMYYADEDLTVRLVEIKKAMFDGNQATKGGAIAFSSSNPEFGEGARGVIGIDATTVDDGDATTEPAYTVVFKNNIARATLTDDPELPTDDGGDDEEGSTSQTETPTEVLGYNGSGGAIYISRTAKVTLYGVLFDGNTAERKGGAVYITSKNARLADYGSCYIGNTAGVDGESERKTSSGSGGAIYSYGTSNARPYVDIDGSTFTANKAFDVSYGGGAIYLTNTKDPTIKNSMFTANSAVNNGGVLAVYGGTQLTLTNNIFGGETSEQGNTAGNHGGAVYIASNGTTVTDNGSSYSNNTAGNHGGAIFAGTNTTLNVDGSSFSANEATKNAGAIYGYTGSKLEIKNGSFTANKAHGSSNGGGAMYFSGATATVDKSEFTENVADYCAGAIAAYSESTLTVTDSSFIKNSAGASGGNGGGAMYLSGGNVELDGVTFTENYSNKNGGAFCAYSKVQVTVKNMTAENNSSKTSGGVIYIGSAGTVVSIYSGSASGNTSKTGNAITCGSSSTLNIKSGEGGFEYDAADISGTAHEL